MPNVMEEPAEDLPEHSSPIREENPPAKKEAVKEEEKKQ